MKPIPFTRTQEEFLAKLRAEKASGGRQRFWHIGKPGAGGGYCGVSYSDSGSMGFTAPWPDIASPFYEFYCTECLSHRPVNQLSLFGD